jgi:hypothetical protein
VVIRIGIAIALLLLSSSHSLSASADSIPVQTANLSQPRHNLAGAAAGNLVLFAGGYTSGVGYSDRVDVFDTSTRSWLNTTNLSQPRYYLAGAAAGNLILFAGGYGSGGYSDRVDVFDTSTRSWLNTTNLSQPRYYLAGAAAGELVLFAGGSTQNRSNSAVVDIMTHQRGAGFPPLISLSPANGWQEQQREAWSCSRAA